MLRLFIVAGAAMVLSACSEEAPVKQEETAKSLAGGQYEASWKVTNLRSVDKTTPATNLKQDASGATLACIAADGTIDPLHKHPGGLPLGIDADEHYFDSMVSLSEGDLLAFYTDGIIEARSSAVTGAGGGEMFDTSRLDAALAGCIGNAADSRDRILAALTTFTANRPPEDDQTLLIARLNGA